MLSLFRNLRGYAAKYYWSAMIFLCLLFFTGVDLWARAGGGGGFHGGGGHGGGFSGGGFHGGSGFHGGGGVPVSPWFIVIVIVVIIIAVVFSVLSKQTSYDHYVTNTINCYNQRQNAGRMEEQLGMITGRDPEFQPEEFKKRGAAVFLKLQDAWSTQDMTPVRTMVSDGIYERFSLQLEIMRDSLLINRMSNISIVDVDLAVVESSRCFDTITLKITASAADCFVHSKTGAVVSGDDSVPARFSEFWTFLRRPGAKTVAGKSLLDNNCPNCGALLEISDRAECPSCKAVVNSGDYDWVLTEITQAEVWQVTESRNIPGGEAMVAKDPSFNAGHIEDRVSVMFFRWIAAQFFADPKYIRKLASASYLSEYDGMFRAQGNGTHAFFADAAVGCVETVEVLPGPEYDKVRVKIKWSGHREIKAVPSLMVPDFEKSRIYTQEFILVRKSGVQSSSRNILNSAHCPNCGAPETLSLQPYCEYCNTPLNDGSQDWVLQEIRPFGGYPLVEPAAIADGKDDIAVTPGLSMLSDSDLDSLLACAASMMLADGEIAPEEYKLLQDYAKARHYDETRLQRLIASVKENTLEVKLPTDRFHQEYFLRCMIRMCLADGKVTPQELDLLRTVGAAMNLTALDVQLKIREERTKLYRQAKGRA